MEITAKDNMYKGHCFYINKDFEAKLLTQNINLTEFIVGQIPFDIKEGQKFSLEIGNDGKLIFK